MSLWTCGHLAATLTNLGPLQYGLILSEVHASASFVSSLQLLYTDSSRSTILGCSCVLPSRAGCFNVQMLHHLATRLEELHGMGYTHRDLKPGNVMWLPSKNRWTIIDFSCAARTGDMAKLGFTLGYAAPEVISAYRHNDQMMLAQVLKLGCDDLLHFSYSRLLSPRHTANVKLIHSLLWKTVLLRPGGLRCVVAGGDGI